MNVPPLLSRRRLSGARGPVESRLRRFPVAAVERFDRHRQGGDVVEGVEVQAPRLGVGARLVEALHPAGGAEQMLRRAGAETVGGQRAPSRQQPEIAVRDDEVAKACHRADRAIAVEPLDLGRPLRLVADRAAMAAARYRHYMGHANACSGGPMPDATTTRRALLGAGLLGAAGIVLFRGAGQPAEAAGQAFEITRSPQDWRKALGPQRYAVLREADTERAGSSPLLNEHRKGLFACAGCNLPLFASDTKFESGTGWPSFFRALPNAVVTRTDRTFGM